MPIGLLLLGAWDNDINRGCGTEGVGNERGVGGQLCSTTNVPHSTSKGVMVCTKASKHPPHHMHQPYLQLIKQHQAYWLLLIKQAREVDEGGSLVVKYQQPALTIGVWVVCNTHQPRLSIASLEAVTAGCCGAAAAAASQPCCFACCIVSPPAAKWAPDTAHPAGHDKSDTARL